MGVEEALPSGVLLTTVENVAGYARKSSAWPATFGPACRAIDLPGCPPRPEMLLDSIVKLHDEIQSMKLGADRDQQIAELEQARLPLAAKLGGHQGPG